MFFEGESKEYFTCNNQMTHCSMHLLANWMRQNHEKIFEKFLQKEGYESGVTTEILLSELKSLLLDLSSWIFCSYCSEAKRRNSSYQKDFNGQEI